MSERLGRGGVEQCYDPGMSVGFSRGAGELSRRTKPPGMDAVLLSKRCGSAWTATATAVRLPLKFLHRTKAGIGNRPELMLLSSSEWEQVDTWAETNFWRQPGRDTAAAVMDGDCWCIQGYREGSYHEVYRQSGSLVDGSGADVYELGRRLAALAGMRSSEERQEE